ARNEVFCNNENQISTWRIDCASDMIVNFEKATLLDKREKSYLVEGSIYAYKEPISEVNISYGKFEKEVCTMEILNKTDENGKFSVKVNLNTNNMLSFHLAGFKTTSIYLNSIK